MGHRCRTNSGCGSTEEITVVGVIVEVVATRVLEVVEGAEANVEVDVGEVEFVGWSFSVSDATQPVRANVMSKAPSRCRIVYPTRMIGGTSRVA